MFPAKFPVPLGWRTPRHPSPSPLCPPSSCARHQRRLGDWKTMCPAFIPHLARKQ